MGLPACSHPVHPPAAPARVPAQAATTTPRAAPAAERTATRAPATTTTTARRAAPAPSAEVRRPAATTATATRRAAPAPIAEAATAAAGRRLQQVRRLNNSLAQLHWQLCSQGFGRGCGCPLDVRHGACTRRLTLRRPGPRRIPTTEPLAQLPGHPSRLPPCACTAGERWRARVCPRPRARRFCSARSDRRPGHTWLRHHHHWPPPVAGAWDTHRWATRGGRENTTPAPTCRTPAPSCICANPN